MMKNIAFFAALLLSPWALIGQEIIPDAVVEAFGKREPGISNALWEYREGAFVALFKHKDGLKKVFFDKQGVWLETRTRIALDALPEGVKKFINEHYLDAHITYIGEVEQPGIPTLYRVESELATYVVIKLLNEQGVLVKENRIDWSFIPN